MNILKSDKGFMEYFNNLDKDKFMKDIESSLEELKKNLNSNTSTESARPSPTEEHTEQPNPVNVG